jgi:hypothetical protein
LGSSSTGLRASCLGASGHAILGAMALVGCPFCQELRPSDEGTQCSVCGIELVPIERLPPSYEARLEEAERLAGVPPEHRILPWWYLARGRGLLSLVAVGALVAFFLPWVHLTRPDVAELSGFDLARYRAPWYWGGAVAWMVTLPLVWSRRTIFALRGVRLIAAIFSSLTLVQVCVLVLGEPEGSALVPVTLTWGYGLYLSAALSVLGLLVASGLGGSLRDITLPSARDPLAARPEESAHDETMH